MGVAAPPAAAGPPGAPYGAPFPDAGSQLIVDAAPMPLGYGAGGATAASPGAASAQQLVVLAERALSIVDVRARDGAAAEWPLLFEGADDHGAPPKPGRDSRGDDDAAAAAPAAPPATPGAALEEPHAGLSSPEPLFHARGRGGSRALA